MMNSVNLPIDITFHVKMETYMVKWYLAMKFVYHLQHNNP